MLFLSPRVLEAVVIGMLASGLRTLRAVTGRWRGRPGPGWPSRIVQAGSRGSICPRGRGAGLGAAAPVCPQPWWGFGQARREWHPESPAEPHRRLQGPGAGGGGLVPAVTRHADGVSPAWHRGPVRGKRLSVRGLAGRHGQCV